MKLTIRETLKNEQGVALVFTLTMIIIITATLTLLLAFMSNTTTQVETLGKQEDAELVAEAGVTYYQALIEHAVKSQSIRTPAGLVIPVSPVNHFLDDTRSFSITGVDTIMNGTSLIIVFTSKGVSGDTSSIIETEFNVRLP